MEITSIDISNNSLVVMNNGEEEIDISGWILERDGFDDDLTIPEDTPSIDPGASLTILCGEDNKDNDDQGVVYAGDVPLWSQSNEEDEEADVVAVLLDQEEEEISRFTLEHEPQEPEEEEEHEEPEEEEEEHEEPQEDEEVSPEDVVVSTEEQEEQEEHEEEEDDSSDWDSSDWDDEDGDWWDDGYEDEYDWDTGDEELGANWYIDMHPEQVADKLVEKSSWPINPITGKYSEAYKVLPDYLKNKVIKAHLDKREFENPIKRGLIDYVIAYKVPQKEEGKESLSDKQIRKGKRSKLLRDFFFAILRNMGVEMRESLSYDKSTVFVKCYFPMHLLVEEAERVGLPTSLRDPDDSDQWPHPDFEKITDEEQAEADKQEALAAVELGEYDFTQAFRISQYCLFEDFSHPYFFFSPASRSFLARSILLSVEYKRPKWAKDSLIHVLPCLGDDIEEGIEDAMVEFDDSASDKKLTKEEREEFRERLMDEARDAQEDAAYFEDDDDEVGGKMKKVTIAWMLKEKHLDAWYPLHSDPSREFDPPEDETDVLEYGSCVMEDGRVWYSNRKWLTENWARPSLTGYFSHQPFDCINVYLGTKLGFYFAFLGWYTAWLVVPGLVGAVAFFFGIGSGSIDSPFTVPFCIFIMLWVTAFLEYWKRRNAYLAHRWSVMDYEENEPNRPEFYGEWRISPITGEPELFYDPWRKGAKYGLGYTVIGMTIAIVIITVIAIMIYRIIASRDGIDRTGISAGVMNALSINVLNFLYQGLAVVLNDWENHRTQTAYDDALIAKTFIFQFINSYVSLFYIAFFKTNADLLGIQDSCSPDCLSELTSQLGSILITKQIIGALIENGTPIIKKYMQTKKQDEEFDEDKLPQWEREYMLPAYDDVFGEYNELAIQFGYITLFVAAFPVAPLLALLNNVVEIRSDANKILTLVRRPPSLRASDIGTWKSIFEVIGGAAVITNALIIAFTSKTLGVNGDWKFWAFIIFEHSVFLMKYAIQVWVPDISQEVLDDVAREEYVIMKALEATQGTARSENVTVTWDMADSEQMTYCVRETGGTHFHSKAVIDAFPKELGGEV